MDNALRELVWRRAAGRCEYCGIPQEFQATPHQIEHITARQHRGPTTEDNLALSCAHCNAHKGPNLSGIDPDTGELTRLFHPRRDNWDEHFEWYGHVLAGRTAVGRATVAVLNINDPIYLALRAGLMAEGVFPPLGRKPS
jgi:hypothetical protein